MKTIILASGSPRRKELLKKAGIRFKVVKSRLREYLDPKLKPHTLAKKLSLEKAKAVYEKNPPAGGKKCIIIAADTLVFCREKILGKPLNEIEAKKMLSILNEKMHSVITGFTIYDPKTNKFITKSVSSKVYFNKISKKDIDDYVTSKKPFDKAGAYGIQELPKKFIKRVDGDFSNVVGLPLGSLLVELKKLGVK